MKHLTVVLALTLSLHATGGMRERDYQMPWCAEAKGVAEYRLMDRTRVDCLTATHAIEFDWGTKWAEAIGQSLYYAARTGKRAGVVLIYKKPSDRRYMVRLKAAIAAHNLPIDVWSIGAVD